MMATPTISLAVGLCCITPSFVNAQDRVTAERIKQVIQNATTNDLYKASGNETRCNLFVRDVIQKLIGQTRPELQGSANEIFDQLHASPNWKKLDLHGANTQQGLKTALDLANAGKIVVVSLKNQTGHGHIAIVVPTESLEQSGAWGIKLPFIAQAGPKNPRHRDDEKEKSVFASLKLSFGFRKLDLDRMDAFVFGD